MSGPGTVARTLELALAERGYREGAGNANKFSKQLGRPAEPWCADFVEATQRNAGVKNVVSSAYTPYRENEYRRRGRLHTTPRPGDEFFVYSPRARRIIHVGFVLRVLAGGRSVLTVEGNTNAGGSANGNGVYVRVRPVLRSPGRAGIRSYGRPEYASQAPAAPRPGNVKKPAKPSPVRALQRAVRVGADGAWGPNTDLALLRIRTAARQGSASGVNVKALQGHVGTAQDGAWGPASKRALDATVRKVQVALGVSPDGDWGPITERAFQAARKANHR